MSKANRIFSTFGLFFLIVMSFQIEAFPHGQQDIILLMDQGSNSHFFGTSSIDGKQQLYQTIKLFESPTWNPPEILSDPLITVSSYDVKKDPLDNFVVAWMGENTTLGIYSLYLRYYVAAIDSWSSINMVSNVTENLVGSYSISIDAQQAEIIWTSYDENFNIENHSATFSLP